MSPYRALLLDFGAVCLKSPVELHGITERGLGLAPGTLTWLGPVDPATDALYRAMLAGELTEREYWYRRAEDVGRAAGRSPFTLRDYFEVCFAGTEEEILRPEIVALAAEARAAGRQVGVLTNDLQAFHGPEFKGRFAFLRDLDAFVDASVSGVLKPDPRAYEAARAALDLPMDAILFVDDQPGNVAGAEAVGMPVEFFDVADVAGSVERVRARFFG